MTKLSERVRRLESRTPPSSSCLCFSWLVGEGLEVSAAQAGDELIARNPEEDESSFIERACRGRKWVFLLHDQLPVETCGA